MIIFKIVLRVSTLFPAIIKYYFLRDITIPQQYVYMKICLIIYKYHLH